jgi:flavin reductase (DIM6/NTAB) family NADH-FMN oxidoreductase RutF
VAPDGPGGREDFSRRFRDAWGRFATGVVVITTVEPDGSVHGMTANGVASVSLEPPLALACVGRVRNTHRLIRSTGRFGLSVLAHSQRSIAEYYVRPAAARTGDVPVTFERLPGDWPVVAGAVAQMGCRLVSEHEGGDHTIFVAHVEAVSIGHERPLVYYRGSYSPLT